MEGTDCPDQEYPLIEEPKRQSTAPPRALGPSSTWTAPHAQFAASAPSMRKAESSGLEGIKLLLAQVDDWTRVHTRSDSVLEDPFNARTETTIHRGLMAESEEYVVWGTAL